MTQLLMSECFNTELDEHADEFVFVGDSPNDAPMFAYFPHAVGVANIRAFAGRIESEPAYVTEAANGAGFCQVVDFLLAGQHASETPEDVKNAKV
jgi:hydroxymethylpyrimidine pyrophosphatase-like HAD family hydrolase